MQDLIEALKRAKSWLSHDVEIEDQTLSSACSEIKLGISEELRLKPSMITLAHFSLGRV
jgi:hypothetical protein